MNHYRYITSEKVRRKWERMAKNITGVLDLSLSIQIGSGSYSCIKDDRIHIVIDPSTVESEDEKLEEWVLKCQGIVAHEAGHIAYSDFSLMGSIRKKEMEARENVPVLAGTDPVDEEAIRKEIYSYIYWKQMAGMLNSIEDGSVEHLVSADVPRLYGAIVAARDCIVAKEIDGARKMREGYASISDSLAPYIMDIRHIATIGYRMELEHLFLKDILDQDSIQKIEELCFYSRFQTETTLERYDIATKLMNWLEPLLQKKADEFFEKYQASLFARDIFEEFLDAQVEQSQTSELSICSGMNADLSGMTPSSKKESPYELNLPDQDEGENSENADDPTKGKEEAKDEKGEAKTSMPDEKERKEMARKAELARKESESLVSKEVEKEQQSERKKAVFDLNCEAGLESLVYATGDENYHRDVTLLVHPSNEFGKPSDAGYEAMEMKGELKKEAASFSRELKEVLMYQAKVRRKNGLKKGKIHESDLSRIITDKRVCQKKIMGKEKKARIQVLLDLSGSMNGTKIVQAIQASYMLVEACSRIHIPISVMGHCFYFDEVEISHFIPFEKCDRDEFKEKVFCAETCGKNQDGMAIYYASSNLVRHQKKDEQLFLFVLSDGAPNGIEGYRGEAARDDMKRIIHFFEKKYDVQTIGIGIGNNISHMSMIYKNPVLVPDVTLLKGELLKILKGIMI